LFEKKKGVYYYAQSITPPIAVILISRFLQSTLSDPPSLKPACCPSNFPPTSYRLCHPAWIYSVKPARVGEFIEAS
jgi:hypothetical protein